MLPYKRFQRKQNLLSINPDLPARGNGNGNGLTNDDLDDDEDENEEESEELATMNNIGKGSKIRTTVDDSRSQSVLCMYNHNLSSH